MPGNKKARRKAAGTDKRRETSVTPAQKVAERVKAVLDQVVARSKEIVDQFQFFADSNTVSNEFLEAVVHQNEVLLSLSKSAPRHQSYPAEVINAAQEMIELSKAKQTTDGEKDAKDVNTASECRVTRLLASMREVTDSLHAHNESIERDDSSKCDAVPSDLSLGGVPIPLEWPQDVRQAIWDYQVTAVELPLHFETLRHAFQVSCAFCIGMQEHPGVHDQDIVAIVASSSANREYQHKRQAALADRAITHQAKLKVIDFSRSKALELSRLDENLEKLDREPGYMCYDTLLEMFPEDEVVVQGPILALKASVGKGSENKDWKEHRPIWWHKMVPILCSAGVLPHQEQDD